jgi:L-seryl-tRNA(Ser) seleniumtransferase
VIHDLGSGILSEPGAIGLSGEMSVGESAAAGTAVSTFSGDKILGGPQAGIAVGRASVIARMRSNPLTRALRPGKLTLAALQATLYSYLEGVADRQVPVLRMITETVETLERRALDILSQLEGTLGDRAALRLVELDSRVGGGAAPERVIPSRGIEVEPLDGTSAAVLSERLLEQTPPVIARTRDDRVLFDLRTVMEEEDESLVQALRGALDTE